MIGLPGFEAFPSPRDGYKMVFRGNAPDESGEPSGEYVEVELIVPPLSFHSLRAMQARAKDGTADTSLEAGVDMVCLALKRNYRGVPRWLVEQSIDNVLLTEVMTRFAEMSRMAAEAKKVVAAS